jgi:Zn finger protein HypA/HybF involved in hydrogenase expression
MVHKELLSPCGLYCGVCGIMMAHRDNNEKLKGKLGSFYGVSPEDIACKGCLSEERFGYCQSCAIRSCTEEKGYAGCHECTDFPCSLIDNFPEPVGKKVILRAIPTWRDLGTEKWVESEEARYVCPRCGNHLFRGARRCGSCKEPVDPD